MKDEIAKWKKDINEVSFMSFLLFFCLVISFFWVVFLGSFVDGFILIGCISCVLFSSALNFISYLRLKILIKQGEDAK